MVLRTWRVDVENPLFVIKLVRKGLMGKFNIPTKKYCSELKLHERYADGAGMSSLLFSIISPNKDGLVQQSHYYLRIALS